MNHKDYLLIVVCACAPCSLRHVLTDCKIQGFGGSRMVKALHELVRDRIVDIDNGDIELGPNWTAGHGHATYTAYLVGNGPANVTDDEIMSVADSDRVAELINRIWARESAA